MLVLRAFAASWLALFAVSLSAQVTFDRLVRASQEPHNWLSYSGGYFSQRYSELAQITPDNVKNLEPAWIYQLTSREPTSTRFEVTPVVVDGVMYIVQPPNESSRSTRSPGRPVLDVLLQPVAAGAALLRPVESRRRDPQDRLFMGTIDGHMVAVDAKTGKLLWDKTIVRPEAGYAFDRRRSSSKTK